MGSSPEGCSEPFTDGQYTGREPRVKNEVLPRHSPCVWRDQHRRAIPSGEITLSTHLAGWCANVSESDLAGVVNQHLSLRNRTSLWITQAPLKKAIDLLIRLCCGRMAVASDHVENLVIAEAMSAFPQKDAEPLSSTEEPKSNF